MDDEEPLAEDVAGDGGVAAGVLEGLPVEVHLAAQAIAEGVAHGGEGDADFGAVDQEQGKAEGGSHG